MRRSPFAILAALVLLPAGLWAAPAETTYQVTVSSTPKGASIAVDGNSCGTAPVTVPNLRAGEHLIVATMAGYEEARRTVTLSDSAPAPTEELQLEPVTGLVLVHSDPKGAEVQVNGADRGKTPLLLSDLPVGKHRVQLSVPGYQPKTLDLNIKDRTPQKLDVSMTSDSAQLKLDSVPAGAAVILNGIDKGKTPCTLDRIPAGDSKVELSMPGYEPFTLPLKLAAGEKIEQTVRLTPVPLTLRVVSIPPKARIYLNDQFKGESPLTLKNMVPGAYRVRAELKGYEVDARTVTLNAPVQEQDKEKTEEFRLARSGGSVQVVTDPPGVKVQIDGVDAGVTVSNATGTSSQPLDIDVATPGLHEVQLTRRGYASKVLTIDVAKNGTASVKEVLMRRFVPDSEVTTTTGIYRGVLVEKDAAGNITLEIKPDTFKVIPVKDIRTVLPITPK